MKVKDKGILNPKENFRDWFNVIYPLRKRMPMNSLFCRVTNNLEKSKKKGK